MKLFAKWPKWPFWVVVTIIAFVVGYVIYGETALKWARNVIKTQHSATVVFTDVFALVFGILLIVLSYYLGAEEPLLEGEDAARHAARKLWRIGRNMFSVLLGALGGWVLALAYTPFGAVDAESLNTIIKTLSVFASGYLVSKLDRFLEGSLFAAGKPTVLWVPLGLFACAFVLSAIVVFVSRVYTDDISRFSVLAFTAPTGNSEMVFGADRIELKDGRLISNGSVITNITIKAGDFIKITPRTRDLEINGRSVGVLPAIEEPKKEKK